MTARTVQALALLAVAVVLVLALAGTVRTAVADMGATIPEAQP